MSASRNSHGVVRGQLNLLDLQRCRADQLPYSGFDVAELAKMILPGVDAAIVAVEPHVESLPDSLSDLGVTLASIDDALKGADAVVLLVDHDVFSDLDRSVLGTAHVHDTRGLWRS